MADDRQRLHAVVTGMVQGVNFRYYTRQAAARLGLTGWVRNREDGAVETVAEGPRPALDEFERFLQRGSPSSQVADVHATRGPASGQFSYFEIRW